MKKNNFTLYPAIDIKNGKCVRLLFGDMEKETIYGENPGVEHSGLLIKVQNGCT